LQRDNETQKSKLFFRKKNSNFFFLQKKCSTTSKGHPGGLLGRRTKPVLTIFFRKIQNFSKKSSKKVVEANGPFDRKAPKGPTGPEVD
jgi:hypothetical protein